MDENEAFASNKNEDRKTKLLGRTSNYITKTAGNCQVKPMIKSQ